MNKKLLALLLAILMVAMSAVAMADSNITTGTIPVSKTFTGNHAAEDVVIAVTPVSAPAQVSPIPAISGITLAQVEQSADGSITIDPSLFTVPGTYVYTISETAGTTAGVTYDSVQYTLKVEVTNESSGKQVSATIRKVGDATETKLGGVSFENVFTADTDGLLVTKTFSGNAADSRDSFTLVVKLATTVNGAPVTSTPVIVRSDSETAPTATDGALTDGTTAKVYTFTGIGKNDTIRFTNIPAGVKWEVFEVLNGNNKAVGDVSGEEYTSTIDVAAGVIGTDKTSTVNNDLSLTVDTGVSTDTMPYILLMAFVAILAVAFVAKKRSVNE